LWYCLCSLPAIKSYVCHRPDLSATKIGGPKKVQSQGQNAICENGKVQKYHYFGQVWEFDLNSVIICSAEFCFGEPKSVNCCTIRQFHNRTSKDSCLSWCQIAPRCKQYKPEKNAKSHFWTPGFIASVSREFLCCRPLCCMCKSPWEVLSCPMTTGQTLEPLANNRAAKMVQMQKWAVFSGCFCGPLVSFSNGEHILLKAIDRAVILDITHKCRQLPAWIGKLGTWHPFTQCKNGKLWCCHSRFRA
jgi:hypothetical protein